MHKDNKKSGASRLVSFLSSVIILIIFFLVGYFLGQKSFFINSKDFIYLRDVSVYNKDSANRVDFSIFWDAWDLLNKKHVDRNDINAQKMVYGAINGMFAATGDPYTNFFDAEENKIFNEVIDGSFEGIGAEIGIRDGFLTIVSPLDDSPAEKSGLRPKDKIIAIDGEQIIESDIDELVKKIRGESGTEVKLTIFRDGSDDVKDFVVTRAKIQLDSVK